MLLTMLQLVLNDFVSNSVVDENGWEQYFPADNIQLQVRNPNDSLKFVTVNVLHTSDCNPGKDHPLLEMLDDRGDVVLCAPLYKPFDIIVSRELTQNDIKL